MFLTKKSSRLTKRERYSDNIPIKDPLGGNEMFDLFFGYRFYQTRVIYDRIRGGGGKRDEKFLSSRNFLVGQYGDKRMASFSLLHSQVLTFGHLLRDIHTLEQ